MQTMPTVLVVDDDHALRKSLSVRLRTLGVRVVTAGDGVEAVMVAVQQRPALLLVDIELPASDGIAVADLMARDARFRDTPLVILTGRSDDATLAACQRLGAKYVQKGSDMWARLLPLVQHLLTPGRSACAGTSAGDPQPSLRPSVLVIDDDRHLHRAYDLRLGAAGWTVRHASTGWEGYAAALQHPPDAIVLDYSMPDGWGDYVLGRLKAHSLTRATPVIVVTGASLSGQPTDRADYALERRMYAMGAASFLVKPIDFSVLVTELAAHVPAATAPRGELHLATA